MTDDRRKESQAFIYLIRPEHSNVYKIGFSIDVEGRKKRLEKKYAFKLIIVNSWLVASQKEALRIETMLHWEFHSYHLAGDWFALDASALLRLKTMVSSMDIEYI